MSKVFVVESSIMDGMRASSKETKCAVFTDFESAKSAFRARLKEYSSADDGKIAKDYIEGLKNPGMGEYDEETDEMIGGEEWYSLVEAVITGEDPKPLSEPIQIRKSDNYFLTWSLTDDTHPVLDIYGDYDGPLNGVDPQMHTNTIVMDDPGMDYYCYFQVHNEEVDEDDLKYVSVDLHMVEL